MFFMIICTWAPGDEREIRTRVSNWEWPSEIKVLYEFFDLQGCRAICVIKADAKGLISARSKWMDIMHFEAFPVFPIGKTRENIQLL
jgi:hypothetical protein